MPDDTLAAEIAAIREDLRVTAELERAGGYKNPTRALKHGLRLLAAVEDVLFVHKIEPLHAHADEGECGCPVPGDYAELAEDAAYEAAHPEGYGPDGSGLVCLKKIAGYWCRGCADVAVEHGCFETPKSYPPGKCDVRPPIERALTGEDGPR